MQEVFTLIIGAVFLYYTAKLIRDSLRRLFGRRSHNFTPREVERLRAIARESEREVEESELEQARRRAR